MRNIGGEAHGGGGILCAAEQTVISDNTIVNNGFRTPLPGSADEPLHGPGAGILLDHSVAVVTNNIIGQVSRSRNDLRERGSLDREQAHPVRPQRRLEQPVASFDLPSYSGDMEDLTGIDGNFKADPESLRPGSHGVCAAAEFPPCVTASESGGVIGALGARLRSTGEEEFPTATSAPAWEWNEVEPCFTG